MISSEAAAEGDKLAGLMADDVEQTYLRIARSKMGRTI
jgi:hypothetical protein